MSISIRHSIFKSTLSYAALVLLFTGVASAQIKTQDFSFNLPITKASSLGNFTLPAFDPSLGTLTDIQLSLTISGSSIEIIYNNQNKEIGFKTIQYALPGSISGPGSLVLNATVPTPVTTPTKVNTGLFLAGGIPLTSTSYTPHETVIDETEPSVLNFWQGANNGVVDLSYSTSNSPSFANLGLPSSFRGTAAVTVAYSYNSTLAAPEPAGKYLSAIVAAGMVFIFLGRRKLLSA